MQQKNVLIAGAGLVGSLLGIFLARRGMKVSIYERRADARKMEVEAGRSINLALSDRGLKALRQVGIAEEIEKIAIPMHGRRIHNREGETYFQPYGKPGQFINSVSRGELNNRLMDMAEELGINIHFDHKLESVDWKNKSVSFSNNEKTVEKNFDILFGADGAYSSVRLQHMLAHQQFDYHQYYINCAYKELSIPAGNGGAFQIEKNALHIWPRGNFMLIALPNVDGSFTGTLFFPVEGEGSFEPIKTGEDVRNFFKKEFADVLPLIPDLEKQFFEHPTSSLVTVKCFPWARGGYFSLIGDAAHALVPFFGQGMNAGFEDVSFLDGLMEEYGDDWEKILSSFQKARKPDADAIADLAVGNFYEMSAKTADPKFLLQKKIEARLHESYADEWVPTYSQVTFSPEIRYSEALENSRLQEELMQEFMKQKNVEEVWKEKDFQESIMTEFRLRKKKDRLL